MISTREAETVVLVRDRQTVVLGGLRERQRDVTRSGIPFLSDIPILGGLFGSQRTIDTETELFFFITPHILADDESTDAVSGELLDGVLEAAEGVTEGVR